MKISSLLSAFLLLFASASCNDQNHSYPPKVSERMIKVENSLAGWVRSGQDDLWNIEDRMKKYNIKGVSIAVINDYKIEWAKGYGFADVSEQRPVTEKTLFQAASISKSLNSLAVLKLVQEGKLDLNTDINKYLVSWKFPYDSRSGGKPVNLAALLSHTAGLTVHGFPGYEQGKELPSLIQVLDGKPPANTAAIRSFEEPGKKYEYSGGGTTISQLLVMDVTGRDYAEYMQKNVLDPLGMISSSYKQPPSAEMKGLLATGYKPDGREVKGKYHIYPEQAAAGLWTNPTDLCKYIIETQLALEGKSSKVISQEMTKLRLTPVALDAGLGTFINSRVTGSVKYFNHNGGNEGFSCTSVGSLEGGKGVVAMTNSDNGVLLEEIVNSVAIVYNWKDYYLPENKTVVNVPENILEKYIGNYDLQGTKAVIKKSGNGLNIRIDPIEWKLNFTTDSDFFIREYRGNLKFRTGAEGKAEGIIINGILMKKTE